MELPIEETNPEEIISVHTYPGYTMTVTRNPNLRKSYRGPDLREIPDFRMELDSVDGYLLEDDEFEK